MPKTSTKPRNLFSLLIGLLLAVVPCTGSRSLPLSGKVLTDARVSAGFPGTVDVRIPPATDPGPMVPTVVRGSSSGPHGPRVAMVDVDGLILNQNLTGLYSVGENPVAAFREKLEAAAADPRVRAVVVRIHSPGGGVAASDLLAEELRRFRVATGKPVVACLMDVATGGAYYLAVGCDRIVALPTSITGGDRRRRQPRQPARRHGRSSTSAYDTIKSGEHVDMGTVTEPLPDDIRALCSSRWPTASATGSPPASPVSRPAMTDGDRSVVGDGRIVAAPKALALHLVDALGYLDDADPRGRATRRASGASEVVLFQRQGYPTHSIYSIVPNVPLQGGPHPAELPRPRPEQAPDVPLPLAARPDPHPAGRTLTPGAVGLGRRNHDQHKRRRGLLSPSRPFPVCERRNQPFGVRRRGVGLAEIAWPGLERGARPLGGHGELGHGRSGEDGDLADLAHRGH